MEENFKKRLAELLNERLVLEGQLVESTRHYSNEVDTNEILNRLGDIRMLLKELTNLNPMLANEVKKEFSES
jgi:hypothetical protein